METVWRGQAVEENSVAVQVSALRRALGPDRELIQTVRRRGCFLGATYRNVDGGHQALNGGAVDNGAPYVLQFANPASRFQTRRVGEYLAAQLQSISTRVHDRSRQLGRVREAKLVTA